MFGSPDVRNTATKNTENPYSTGPAQVSKFTINMVSQNEPVSFLEHINRTANRHGIQKFLFGPNSLIRAGEFELMRTQSIHKP